MESAGAALVWSPPCRYPAACTLCATFRTALPAAMASAFEERALARLSNTSDGLFKRASSGVSDGRRTSLSTEVAVKLFSGELAPDAVRGWGWSGVQ